MARSLAKCSFEKCPNKRCAQQDALHVRPEMCSYLLMKVHILSVFIMLFANRPVSAQEMVTLENPVEQAQSKALAKERKNACAILNSGLEAAKTQPKVKQKLLEALETISTTFFTDKGQKLYESAQSVLFETPEVAIVRLKEALLLEDQNLLLNMALARAYLVKGDSSLAKEAIDRARALNPSSGEAAVLELRILVAQKSYELLREKLKALPPQNNKNQEIYVRQVTAQDFWEQQMTEQAYDILLKNTEGDSDYPETYYFLSKMGAELSKGGEEWAKKYVLLCKGVDAKIRRKYANEPKLCANVKEIEDELVKKSSEI